MKKDVYKPFNTTLLSLMLIPQLITANENSDNIYGDVSGVIRFYYVFNPSYVKSGRSEDYSLEGSAFGGHIKYSSPTYKNFSFSSALYYVIDPKLNDTDDVNTMVAAGRFFTQDYSNKAVLAELNLLYKNKNHKLEIGRVKIDSPLTNSISTYMPNMFEAISYKNSQFDDFEFILLQIEKMAYGTRSPVEFGLIGETTRTAGATQSGINSRGDFLTIEQQVLADSSVDTNGVTAFAILNKSIKNTTIRIWDLYAHDIINMLYIDSIYKDSETTLPYKISAQYLNVKTVGKDLASSWVDKSSAYMLGLRFDVRYNNISAFIAYNHSGDAKLLNPFSGDPAYTSSFFSRNAYRANVDAYKIGTVFKLSDEFKVLANYADYGRSTTLGTFAPSLPVEAQSEPDADAMESSLLFSYNPLKELNFLTGVIYKTSEYFYNSKQVKLLDLDFIATYKF